MSVFCSAICLSEDCLGEATFSGKPVPRPCCSGFALNPLVVVRWAEAADRHRPGAAEGEPAAPRGFCSVFH